MVLYCIALHVWWATVLIIDGSGVGATAVSALHGWFGTALPGVLLSVAVMAFIALFLREPGWIVLFLIPQEIILIFSASGAISAIWLSQFADGVVRSRGFIANDVALNILAAVFYTVAVIAHARKRAQNER